jgi:hypothetical protein
LYQASPVGNSYSYHNKLSPDVCLYLQQIAWQVVSGQ